MGYRLGYYIICFSPLISLLLLFISTLASGAPSLVNIKRAAIIHTSIITIQLSGLTLYVSGLTLHLLRSRNHLARPKFLINPIIVSIVLVIWGLFTSIWAYTWDINILLWSGEEGNRELTVWDHMQYFTWILKGLIWIIAGLGILATAPKSREETK
jgi:hypothetical protein